MSTALIVTAVVLILTVIAFFTEILPAGQIAMLAAIALVSAQVITAEHLFEGFANPATITVGAMFVVSAALYHTGALDSVGDLLSRLLDRSRFVGLLVVCVGASVLSAFINNTTVVAIMLPVIVASSRSAGVSPSRLLMPLSFAAMLGGTCTLIGTSTNLVVDSFAKREGLAGIGVFELAPVGLALVGITLVYLLVAGRWLVPERRELEPEDDEREREYIVDLEVTGELERGMRIGGNPLLAQVECEPLEIWRNGMVLGGILGTRTRIMPGDVIRLHCSAEDVGKLLEHAELRAATAPELSNLEGEDVVLVEALVGPGSALSGRKVAELSLRERLGAVILGLWREGVRHDRRVAQLRLRSGDLLLLACDRERIDELERHGDLVLVSKVSSARPRNRRMPIAIATLVAVVGVAASGLLDIATAALAGAIAVLITGCIRLNEAIEAIDWNVMLLLAGVLSLGAAMTESGAAMQVAELFVIAADGLDLRLAIALVYTGTVLLTSVLSNNATAALLTPIAIDIAIGLGVDARPLVMTVAFGASTALLTPVGYQTNTMVYGAGRYRFSDYARVGGPLLLLLIPTVALLIPLVWKP